jgi:O-antigen/teichoic acid export membrane protein
MRSASVSEQGALHDAARVLTEGENTFRIAKLQSPTLVAYKAIADLAGKSSIFFVTILAARRLSPWAFGVFGLGTTLGWILAVVTDFGVQMHLARAVARTPDHAPALLRRWWRVRTMSAAAGLVLLAAVLALLRVSAQLAVPLFLFAVVYSVTGLVELVNYFYRGLSRSDIESTLTIWQRAAALALGVGALLWRPDATPLAIALLLPVVAALAWTLWHARAVRPAVLPSAAPADTFFRDVFPIGIGIVFSALYFRIDVLLVELWAGTEAVAGYNAVFRLIDALRLFPAAVLAVSLPALCRADDLMPLARVSAAVTAFAVVAAAALWVAADTLVPMLYGARYRSTVPAFRILALTFPLLSLNFALTHQLVGWNRQRAYAVVCGAALAVNVALNAWLIPAWSIQGAAWATLGTELCVTSGCLVALGTPGAPVVTSSPA